jgi:4-hydroxyphenylpyruvate dioxygenase
MAAIKTYGDTIHTLVERSNYNGPFLPGYESRKSVYPAQVGRPAICGPLRGQRRTRRHEQMGQILPGRDGVQTAHHLRRQGYQHRIQRPDVESGQNGNGYIKFPINEPAKGLKKSQIEEYLDFYRSQACNISP